MPLKIRPSKIKDADSIGSLAAEFQAYLRALGDEADFDWGATKYLRDGFGENPAFEGLVAEVDCDVVGYSLYHFGYDTDRGQRLIHVIDLYVGEAFRRCGIGNALMDQVAAVGRSRGAELMLWSVYTRNELALEFYKKVGGNYVAGLHFMWKTI